MPWPVAAKVALAAGTVMTVPSVATIAAQSTDPGFERFIQVLEVDHGVPAVVAKAAIKASQEAPCPIEYRTLLGVSGVESGHGGRYTSIDPLTGDGVGSIVSTANAQGFTQFIDSTWAQWKTDGNGDGITSRDNVYDAMASSAAYLCSMHIDEDWEEAIGSYNGGSGWRGKSESIAYVPMVRDRMNALPAIDGTAKWQISTGRSTKQLRTGAGGWMLDQWDSAVALGHEHAPGLNFATDAVNGVVYYNQTPGGVNVAAPVGGSTCPVPEAEFTDDFGDPRGGGTRTHEGNDLFAPMGSPIVAPSSGTVKQVVDTEAAGGLGGIGLYFTEDSGDEWYFAHNSTNIAREGQRVSAGTLLAKVGDTGNARGGAAHAHTQWYPKGGGLQNPYDRLTQLCGGAPRDLVGNAPVPLPDLLYGSV